MIFMVCGAMLLFLGTRGCGFGPAHGSSRGPLSDRTTLPRFAPPRVPAPVFSGEYHYRAMRCGYLNPVTGCVTGNVRSRPSWAVVAPGMAGKFPVYRMTVRGRCLSWCRGGWLSGVGGPGKRSLYLL